jgi:thymidylate synthase (FAD)
MTQIKVSLIDHMGSDLSVVNAARVSFGKQSEWVEGSEDDHHREEWGTGRHDGEIFYYKLSDRDQKLIRYLAKHKHMSPFGHAFASFHVKAPIFVARQLVKHKFLRWNEISRRYVDDEPEFYVPEVWRGKSADKKQGSSGIVELGFFSAEGGRFEGYFGEQTLAEAVAQYPQDMRGLYEALILVGVAPEQARMVLPQSTMTEWYWSGSLDAFADMCRLRCASDTQYETRIVADQISAVMRELFPVSWPVLVGDE